MNITGNMINGQIRFDGARAEFELMAEVIGRTLRDFPDAATLRTTFYTNLDSNIGMGQEAPASPGKETDK